MTTTKPIHPWLQKINVSFVPGPITPLMEELLSNLRGQFQDMGHKTQDDPDNETDIILTTAPYGDPISWRKAVLFTARRNFKLKSLPVTYTLIHITPQQFDDAISHFDTALSQKTVNPADFLFPGLSPISHRVLIEQGNRGGAILSLMRLLQAQSKSIRVLLVVGDEHPQRLYHFDLVGAHPFSDGADQKAFYEDIVQRIVTTESTVEVTQHQVVGETIPYAQWQKLKTPGAMSVAGREVGKRNFFTDLIRIEDLVHVPAVSDAVAEQYSEGCFATWDPEIESLIATVTGSSRPVNKENITEDELAVIVGVRPDELGALVRHVESKRNDPPSSEAVEMMSMDIALPKIKLGTEWGIEKQVPVMRSKLHSHRGVRTYDPNLVEYVPLDPPFYHYLVSCATASQADGIKAAFGRAECLLNPDDPRIAAFTVLPGHGVVAVEKWVSGKQPFQVLWEFMDTGSLEIDTRIPQGLMAYKEGEDGRMRLSE